MKLKIWNRNALVSAFMLVVIMFGVMPNASPVMALPICDRAKFVADVTVPDGTNYAPGSSFTKTWRLQNDGACTWTTGYSLVFVDGSLMGAPVAVALTSSVGPGGTVDLSVPMVAPVSPGTYRGNWQVRNASGINFGIGAYANLSFWVEIRVSGALPSGTVFDFAANAPSSIWSSGAGALPFPGSDGDARGFAKVLAAPLLENGTTDSAPGILTVPQDVYNGYIQGVFPAFSVQSGDRFQAIINCEYNATACFVNFRLNYQIGSGPIQTLWSFNERYDHLFYRANIDLTALAGQSVKFILYVGSAGYSAGDRALWGSPKIVRSGAISPTPVPGPTSVPVTPGTSGCDRASFIADVNVPDGTVFAPNTSFTKIWRIKNVGTCTWTTSYRLVFVSGDKMSGPDYVNLTSTIGPNTSFDLPVNLVAPSTMGTYRGYWQLRNASGALFGIGYYADKPWWVEIYVNSSAAVPTSTPGSGISTPVPSATIVPTATTVPSATPVPTATTVPSGTVLDFTSNPAGTVWTNNVGSITYGVDPSADGVAKTFSSIQLEDSSTDARSTLMMVPKDQVDGYVKGVFPALTISATDHFKATIGCQYAANDCYVRYVLDYQEDGLPTLHNLINYTERYEGMIRTIDIDLGSLSGRSIKFILTVVAISGTHGAVDRAVWVAPRITR